MSGKVTVTMVVNVQANELVVKELVKYKGISIYTD